MIAWKLKPEHRRILGDYAVDSLFIRDFQFDAGTREGEATYEIVQTIYSRSIDHLTSVQAQLCVNQGLFLFAYELGMLKQVFAVSDERKTDANVVCEARIANQTIAFQKRIDPSRPVTCKFSVQDLDPRMKVTKLTARFEFNSGACVGTVSAVLVHP